MTVVVDDSYQLGTFRDNQDSLRRLQKQAGVVADLEMNILKDAGLKSGDRVLDMGCGPGIVAAQISSRILPSEIVAADCNDISLAETQKHFKEKGIKNGKVLNLNIYDSDLHSHGPFDFAYSRLVFQHLSEPLNALRSVYKSLSIGGRYCICDIDDQWLSLNIDLPELHSFLGRVANSQEKRGGDRHIGRKLSSYMKSAGFVDIRSQSLLLSTDLVTKEEFFDLIFGYKLEVVAKDELELAQKELSVIKSVMFEHNAWAGVCVFFVTGIRANDH